MTDNPSANTFPRGDEPDATRTFEHAEARGDALLGQVAGNYHLLARAGKGAFGTVYRARDVRLDRTVAVKFLDGPATEAARQRFEQEARAVARLGKHAAIVDIYAWGEHEGHSYLAFEYLPQSADGLLAAHPSGLPLGDALRVARQCAQALGAAHRAGVVHGDIKPSNILLTADGRQAKLCDFGMAQMAGGAERRGGSPSFIAPECACGQATSPASDIYSLGATLFTLLTGTPPIASQDANEALEASASGHLQSLAALRPDLPRSVVDLVARSMAMDPGQRFESMEAFEVALKNEVAPPQMREPKRPPLIRRALRWAAMILLLMAGGIALLLVQGLLPVGSGNSVLLADARLSLNQGDYDTARAGFEQYLSAQPESAEARYGLAYAFLLEGNQEQAAAEFARLGEEALREEGEAAVAYMASGEAARPALEHAAEQQTGGYAAVLLALLDMMAGNFDSAQTRLDSVQESELPFDWQRRQYLQTLGQLQFKAGNYEAAEAVFARLERSGSVAQDTFVADYAALAKRRSESESREDTGERLARLKVLREQASDVTPTEAWSSRPLAMWIPPVDAGSGIIARESGLADVLPWRIGLALTKESRVAVTPVERGAEADILAEQELSATLGNEQEAIRLGRVLGARLLLLSRVMRLFGEEVLHLTLVDIETTRQIPVGEYPIQRNLEPAPWVESLLDDLVASVQRNYPLRGTVIGNGQEAILDIGRAAGVREGMVFRPVANNGQEIALTVTSVRNDRESNLSLVGADSLPPEGWKVEQSLELPDAP